MGYRLRALLSFPDAETLAAADAVFLGAFALLAMNDRGPDALALQLMERFGESSMAEALLSPPPPLWSSKAFKKAMEERGFFPSTAGGATAYISAIFLRLVHRGVSCGGPSRRVWSFSATQAGGIQRQLCLGQGAGEDLYGEKRKRPGGYGTPGTGVPFPGEYEYPGTEFPFRLKYARPSLKR
ncbi:hypothetical protein MASR2M17_20770 [Aminivibrio sp.]